MTPERWRIITELMNIAREMKPHEADEFLHKACRDDPSLYEDVRSMLDVDSVSGPLDRSVGSLLRPSAGAASPLQIPGIPPGFQPGDLIAGRYRIVRFLNRGGMGEVYEAEQLLLPDTRVALKTLLPSIASDAGMIARFKQEITLSRQISHRNVCPVYDLDRHTNGSYFLTMKFLRGETLAAKLEREGPMSPSIAVPLLAQVAAALDAAHAEGVIHRDLKPSNIMLVPEERQSDGFAAVVTDFGLARRFKPGEASGDRTTQVLGTLDYMAPELFAGRQATVASDVFALGMVAHKMVDGAERVDDKLNRLIRGCVDPDPARRPRPADVLAALARVGEPAKFGWRYLSVILALAVLFVSLFVFAYRYLHQGEGMPPGTQVYLTAMNNATQDAELDSAGELLRNHLRQSGHLRLLDDARISRARSLMGDIGQKVNTAASAREVALRAGAALVVFTTLARIADTYDLNVEIQRVGGTPVIARRQWRNHWSALSKPLIFTTIHDAGDWIRTIAGEDAASVAERDLAPEDAASSSWEALSLYRLSETLKAAGKIDGAIALLRRAIELDADFALAHVRIADYLSGSHQQEEAYQHYQHALSAGARRRLTSWEELQLRGSYALDLGDYKAAEAAFAELRALYPADPIPPHYLAAAVRFQGRLEDAAVLEQEALAKSPEATAPVVGLMGDHVLLGRLDEAERDARKLADLGARAMSTKYLGIIDFLRGDFAGAKAIFETVLGDASPSQRSQASSLLGAFFAEKGMFDLAFVQYKAGAAADAAAGMRVQVAAKYLALAVLQYRNHQFTEARTSCLEALRMQRRLDLYRRCAMVLARSGFVADAQHLLHELGPDWPGPLADAARHQIQGEILMQSGDRQAALGHFEAASLLDPPFRDREYLARAYALTGDHGRALFQYESTLRSLNPYWQYPDAAIPAFYTSTLLDYAAVALNSGDGSRAETALREYFRLRGSADSNTPESVAAQRLRADLSAAQSNRKD